MALDPKYVGRAYGPFVYEAGREKMREFAYAVGGTIPSVSFSALGAPSELHPWLHDDEAGRQSPYGSMIAMPNFAVAFALTPFSKAILDPDLGIDLLWLVHAEQEFEFFTPVKPGDVLTTTGVIDEIYGRAGKDFLVVKTESKNQRHELVVRGAWTAVIRQA